MENIEKRAIEIVLPELPKIKWPKAKVKKIVKDLLAKYDDVELTEEQEELIAGDLASIRKIYTNLDNKKKTVKKDWNKPYKVFEDELKLILADVKKVEDKVKIKYDKYIEKQNKIKHDKIVALEEYDNIKEFITFDDEWYKTKWNFKKIAAWLKVELDRIQTGIKTIKASCKIAELKNYTYLELYKTKALEFVLDEIQKAYDIIQRNKVKVVETVKEPEPVAKPVNKPKPVVKNGVKIYTIIREMVGSKEQLTKLNDYALALGIVWNKIDE